MSKTPKMKIPLEGLTAKPDRPAAAPANLDRSPSTLPKPIQIRVPIEKHSEIKAYAAEQQLSITDLLMKAYEEYRARHK